MKATMAGAIRYIDLKAAWPGRNTAGLTSRIESKPAKTATKKNILQATYTRPMRLLTAAYRWPAESLAEIPVAWPRYEQPIGGL